jgi:hypothetical protein
VFPYKFNGFSCEKIAEDASEEERMLAILSNGLKATLVGCMMLHLINQYEEARDREHDEDEGQESTNGWKDFFELVAASTSDLAASELFYATIDMLVEMDIIHSTVQGSDTVH